MCYHFFLLDFDLGIMMQGIWEYFEDRGATTYLDLPPAYIIPLTMSIGTPTLDPKEKEKIFDQTKNPNSFRSETIQ